MSAANLFKHRMDATEIGEMHLVEDAIFQAVDRANGILVLLQINFSEGMENQAADHVVDKALSSIQAELTDIREIFKAYRSSTLESKVAP